MPHAKPDSDDKINHYVRENPMIGSTGIPGIPHGIIINITLAIFHI